MCYLHSVRRHPALKHPAFVKKLSLDPILTDSQKGHKSNRSDRSDRSDTSQPATMICIAGSVWSTDPTQPAAMRRSAGFCVKVQIHPRKHVLLMDHSGQATTRATNRSHRSGIYLSIYLSICNKNIEVTKSENRRSVTRCHTWCRVRHHVCGDPSPL